MKRKKIRASYVADFVEYLCREEKSPATIKKYERDVRNFRKFIGHRTMNKEAVINYKIQISKSYAPASVNSMIASLNSFFRYVGYDECCLKYVKVQKQMFEADEKNLSYDDYRKLLDIAGDSQIGAIIKTLCGTGIRVSELKYITVSAVRCGKAVVECKNKKRIILIPHHMQNFLISYILKNDIKDGPVFVSRNGNPVDRTNIWKKMKELCMEADVSPEKVFPHNLRHLFARMFYSMDGDIVRLADVLGHSNINTTRIYTMETGREHLELLEKLQEILTT
ncbi:MAG: tyrosine-type recombinase/integrase [Anaerovoracaceae bacterium]|nr:tyrosine-type recombinase/integrase [Bacillota bacterium]MEE0517362.1 tyrosine-type recombinase/integrase [Anaerovoracaceae bacterium]